MTKSSLLEGNQKLIPGRQPIYGLSITDACLGWADSEALAQELAEAVVKRKQHLRKVQGQSVRTAR